MRHELRPALVIMVVMTLLTGFLYPFAITVVAQLAFPYQANGSLIRRGDQVIGSALIGQAFNGPQWFQSRPSATSEPYNGTPSVGANLGPLHPDLATALLERAAAVRAANPGATGTLPVDLITTSGSGLDPHISPASAALQVASVARVRNTSDAAVRSLVDAHVESRQFGILGEARVNVLRLNLALDSIAPLPRVTP